VRVDGRTVHVRVHSVGAVDAPGSTVVIRDEAGRTLASVPVPAIAAPADLRPKTADVVLTMPAGTPPRGATVAVEMRGVLPEITLRNNVVKGVF